MASGMMREAESEPAFVHMPEELQSRTSMRRRLQRRLTNFREIAQIVRKKKRQLFACGAIIGIVAGIAFLVSLARTSQVASEIICGSQQINFQQIAHYSARSNNLVAVNLGGWLCLEDWFFSGSIGRYVSTPGSMPQGQGACLPPMVTGPLDEPWPSEGILVNRLNRSKGSQFTVTAFQAHRDSFINDLDFKEIAALGIRTVRIPFTWAMFADALAPLDKKIYGSHDPEHETVLVPDPYYVDKVSMSTIPRTWMRNVIRLAKKEGLRVILDMHSMPGGSSDGTYSGVWPLRPQFWIGNASIGGGNLPLFEIGKWLAKALIGWVETLDDLVDDHAIRGLCVINEPGHLSAYASPPWANEQQILDFIDHYTANFRASSLPRRGVRLYLQIIATAFKNMDAVVPEWYHRQYTYEERHTWAVIAFHYYTAWNGACNGAVIPGFGYICDEPLPKIRSLLQNCIEAYGKTFAASYDGLRSITEWSLGSNSDNLIACTNSEVLRVLFEENVKAFALAEQGSLVEPIFWSWKMPYGPRFQPGWSLKYFSGMSTFETQAANGTCMVGSWAKI